MTISQLGYRFWSIFSLKTETKLNRLLLILFFIVGLIGIIHHEMWRDEFQAWLIAQDSNSLTQLRENIEYVGHPLLWYLCLYVLSLFTDNFFFVQLFHLAIATAFVGVFLKFSPFSNLQKALFCFGYFPLYEYGILSRNYSFGILFIFIFCALFPSRDRNYLPLAVTLALLSNTNLYGLIVGFSLAATLAIDILLNTERVKNLYAKRWNLLASFTIYSLGLIAAMWQIIPPQGAGYKADILTPPQGETITGLADHIRRLGKAITGIWNSYFPVPNFDIHYWNTNILDFLAINIPVLDLDAIYWSDLIILLFSILLLAASILLFIRQPIILFLYVSATTAMILCAYAVRSPSMRHSGHYYIVFSICFWLSTYLPKNRNGIKKRRHKLIAFFDRNQSKILTIILCIHLLAGATAYAMDLALPFSASKNAANFIKDNQLDKLTIVGSEDARVSPLSARLNKSIYYPESEQFGSFTVWTDNKNKPNININTNHSEILQQIVGLINSDNSKILLVLDRKLDASLPVLKIMPLTQFDRSVVDDEVYYLYLVTNSN